MAYACAKCGKVFDGRQAVRLHIRKVHEITGYKRVAGTGKRYTSLITPEHTVVETGI